MIVQAAVGREAVERRDRVLRQSMPPAARFSRR
jgi:hypothetical protein